VRLLPHFRPSERFWPRFEKAVYIMQAVGMVVVVGAAAVFIGATVAASSRTTTIAARSAANATQANRAAIARSQQLILELRADLTASAELNRHYLLCIAFILAQEAKMNGQKVMGLPKITTSCRVLVVPVQLPPVQPTTPAPSPSSSPSPSPSAKIAIHHCQRLPNGRCKKK